MSNCRPIPRRRFKIEGEAFMITSHDSKEANTFNETLKSSVRDL